MSKTINTACVSGNPQLVAGTLTFGLGPTRDTSVPLLSLTVSAGAMFHSVAALQAVDKLKTTSVVAGLIGIAYEDSSGSQLWVSLDGAAILGLTTSTPHFVGTVTASQDDIAQGGFEAGVAVGIAIAQ